MPQLYTTVDAARVLGISRRTLAYHLEKGHITRSGSRPRSTRRYFTDADIDAFRSRPGRWRTTEEWDEIARRYHAGETADALAAEFGMNAVKLQVKVGSRRSYLNSEAWEEILRRKRAGETAAALAAEFGVSASRVNARARKAG